MLFPNYYFCFTYCAEDDEQGDIVDKEFGAFPLEKSFPNLTTDRPPAIDLYSDLFEGNGKEEGITWLRARVSAVGGSLDDALRFV